MAADLKFETSSVGNTIELLFDARHKHETIFVTVEHPWHGDSNSGFGCTLMDALTRDQAEQLYWWLKGHLGK